MPNRKFSIYLRFTALMTINKVLKQPFRGVPTKKCYFGVGVLP